MESETMEPNRSCSTRSKQPSPGEDCGMDIGIYVISYAYLIVRSEKVISESREDNLTTRQGAE